MATTDPRTRYAFFRGTTDEAIAASLERCLPLVCVVVDGSGESSIWEYEYLVDDEIFELLQSEVIVLRLEAGTHDAQLLADASGITKTPNLLIIKDGTTMVQLLAGVSREHFIYHIKYALIRIAEERSSLYPAPVQSAGNVQQQQSSLPQSPPPVTVTATPTTANSVDRPESPRGTPSPYPSSQTALPSNNAAATTTDAVASTASADVMSTGRRESVRLTFGEQQRLKQVAERTERQRILQLLEYDKAERRLRDKERRESVVMTEQLRPRFPDVAATASGSGDTGKGGVALSFRLTDGSNVKFRFPPEATLGADVRTWIEENRTDGDRPYNFMEILGPARNRSLSISDEGEALSHLFKRSATLVLVPTQSTVVEAYGKAPVGSGYGVHAILSDAYAMISGAANAVWSFAPFASKAVDPPPPPPRREGRRVGTAESNIRTLGDRTDDDSERRHYNGNQSSLEPKPDDK